MQILVLGGADAQAAYAVEKVIADDYFDEVVIADYNKDAADAVVARYDSPKMSAQQIDVFDKERLTQMMNSADVVVNCTGPYYKLLVPVIDALMESSCKNYADLCDDIEAFEAVMTPERMAEAEERDMRIIVGLGGSPGLIPVEMMYGASLMDEVDTINLNMLMDELNEAGPAVWDHMLENFAGEITVWKDGKEQTEQGLEEVLDYEFDPDVFPGVGTVRLYTLGHPEVYTIPKVMPDIKNIDIKTSYYPPSVQEMIVSLDRMGMLSTDSVKVGDEEITPRALLIEQFMDNIFDNDEVEGGWDPSVRDSNNLISGSAIEVHGTKDGKPVTYKSSFTTTMGPVTGYPLAVGARMLAKGEVEPVGIMIPEQAILQQEDFVNEVFDSIEEAGHPLRRKAEAVYTVA